MNLFNLSISKSSLVSIAKVGTCSLHIFTSFCVLELCFPPITIIQSTSTDNSLAACCLVFVAEQIVFLKVILSNFLDSIFTISLYNSKFSVVWATRQYLLLLSKFKLFTSSIDYKFFLVATPEERGKRRYKELVNKGYDVNLEEIISDIIKRDEIDSNREFAPLVKADDAIEIDTTGKSINEVVQSVLSKINI